MLTAVTVTVTVTVTVYYAVLIWEESEAPRLLLHSLLPDLPQYHTPGLRSSSTHLQVCVCCSTPDNVPLHVVTEWRRYCHCIHHDAENSEPR